MLQALTLEVCWSIPCDLTKQCLINLMAVFFQYSDVFIMFPYFSIAVMKVLNNCFIFSSSAIWAPELGQSVQCPAHAASSQFAQHKKWTQWEGSQHQPCPNWGNRFVLSCSVSCLLGVGIFLDYTFTGEVIRFVKLGMWNEMEAVWIKRLMLS